MSLFVAPAAKKSSKGLNLVLQLCGQALQWLSALKLLSSLVFAETTCRSQSELVFFGYCTIIPEAHLGRSWGCAQQFDIISVNSVMVTTARCQLWQETMHLMNAIPQLRRLDVRISLGFGVLTWDPGTQHLGKVDSMDLSSIMKLCTV